MEFPDPGKPLAEQEENVLHAMLVWGEARGESPRGRSAVAHVPVTRLRLKRSKSVRLRTLKDELLRPYAFSCFLAAMVEKERLLTPVEHGGLGSWALCYGAAAEARARLSDNPAPGATHYCRHELWAMPGDKWFCDQEILAGRTQLVGRVDSHVFAIARF